MGAGVLRGGVGGCWGGGVGCWAMTPEKIEHSLNGRKHIVQLAKVPPPTPLLASKIEWSVPKISFTLFQNEFHTAFTWKII